MAKDILKEAIADAKAVREVALANAKAALEEAFTPKLQSMLSAKLSEDLDEDYYEEDMDNEGMMYDEEKDMEEMMYDEDMDETMYDEDMDEMMHDKDKKEEASMDEEIDLEEILNELEIEEGDVAEKKDEDEDVIEDEENFDLDSLLEEINSLDKKPIKEAKRVVKRPHSLKRTAPIPNRITENLKGGCKEKTATLNRTKKDLIETKKALETVKSELNEVNLLNSKLLYVNRIFKSNDLDDPQKLRVVETLDKAGSVKEAKLIYETIKDSFSISNEALEKEIKKEIKNTVKNKISRKPIRENLGMASKATGTTAPKRPIINESNNMISRFQKLANIKINE